jgi:hypothetical protein
MWNTSKKDFEELYEKIPKAKPYFDTVWRLAGGNPYIFSELHAIGWQVDKTIDTLIDENSINPSFINNWRKWLGKVVEDPDTLLSSDTPHIVYFLRDRDPELWIDEPLPEKDLEIGIGKHVA